MKILTAMTAEQQTNNKSIIQSKLIYPQFAKFDHQHNEGAITARWRLFIYVDRKLALGINI